jgi:adenylate cyclase
MSEANRRLAGILAADVVGYSAMVGTDEPGTLARVRALRTDLIDPLSAAHSGRLFKTTGDGFFITFASAVQALQCAVAIQDTLRTQADSLARASVCTRARWCPRVTTCWATALSLPPG